MTTSKKPRKRRSKTAAHRGPVGRLEKTKRKRKYLKKKGSARSAQEGGEYAVRREQGLEENGKKRRSGGDLGPFGWVLDKATTGQKGAPREGGKGTRPYWTFLRF